MADPVKAAETPVVETPKVADGESLIDNRRTQIENLVITENETFPEPEIQPEAETPKDEKKAEDVSADPVERIKSAVQKRIDKVIAQKKSAEEELAEARAEIERLKAAPKVPDPVSPKDNTPPTPEQVEAYIVKMREEGNTKEEIAATRYLIKLEKEIALKEIEERQTKTQKEAEAAKAQQLADWTNLARDYVDYDESGKINAKSEMNLSNQNGLLYKTALSLYNDKELHAEHYNDSNVIQGFRRAVADAYREIHQQGLHKSTPKGEQVIPRSPRMALADPSAETTEDNQPNTSNSLSDAEKVREEIRARNKNRFLRKVPQ